jgi:pimeloyl-ACP methyl ester carboxylesterase
MRALALTLTIAACSPGLHAPPSGPIREAAFVKLGGIDQWITIRGANRANPILLVVHGGPGDAQSVFPSLYEGYEADFTVVQWDQRGAARTFRANPTAVPEPDRVIGDGVELAQYLARRFARPIIVVGHSWGSYLAVGMAQRRPDAFAACVGTGQVGTWTENVKAQFDFLLSHARAAGDHETVAKLEEIGTPDPTSAEQYFSWWSIRNPYIAPSDRALIAKLVAGIKDDPATAELVGAGMEFSGKALVGAMLAEDLPRTVPRLDVPFIVIQGADDMITPTSVAASYFAVVQAPSKKMITIPNAGHFAIVTHVAEFRAALLRDVRPFALRSGT